MPTNFYLNAATGNNLNAGDGSTLISDTGGTLYTGTPGTPGTPTTSSYYQSTGTPFGNANSLSGQWVALSVAGDSAARFVAQITANTSSTLTFANETVTGSTCTVLGSRSGLTSVNARVGGAWMDLGIYGLATTGVNAAMASPLASTQAGLDLILWFQAGTTYSQGTTAVTTSAGSVNHPILWKGYNATIGDLDNLANATRPLISFGTLAASGITFGNYNQVRNINFSGAAAANNGVLYLGAGSVVLERCRITCTSNYGFYCAGGTLIAMGCYFSGVSGSGIAGVGSGTLTGCSFRTITGRCLFLTASVWSINSCILNSAVSDTISLGSGAILNATNCTLCGNISGYSQSTYAINVGNLAANANATVVNCLFLRYGTNAIFSSNATSGIRAINCNYYSVPSFASANVQGAVLINNVLETSDPCPGYASYDFTLTSTAASRQAGYPGQFEV